MIFRFLYKQDFSLPSEDQIPNLYTMLLFGADTEDYIFQMRGSGWTADGGNAAWPGMMTNAAWSHNWMMNVYFWDVQDYTNMEQFTPFSSGYEALLVSPDGGINYFNVNNTNQTLNPSTMLTDPLSKVQMQPLSGSYPTYGHSTTNAQGIFWGYPTDGFKLIYPDGSQDILNLAAEGGNAFVADALLTQHIDPQGRITRLGYEYTNLTSSCYNQYNEQAQYGGLRVKYVVDSDGRTNTFKYETNAPTHIWELTEIDSPYSNKVALTYGPCDNGVLESITDAAGNSNYFAYQSAIYVSLGYGEDFVVNAGMTNIITPYGDTSFYYYQQTENDVTNGVQERAIYVTEPADASQLFAYVHNSSNNLASSANPPNVPGVVFDTGTNGGAEQALFHRNSFYWDRRQTPNLSTYSELPRDLAGAISGLTTNDLQKARMRHWLLGGDNVSITESISSEQEPSPDEGGTIEGTRTWYGYTNNSPADHQVTMQVAAVAQTLPDGTSQYALYSYYSSGLAATNEQSYSLPGGGVGELTNWFSYAANSIDLTCTSNSLGQYFNVGYNTNHQAVAVTNALGQITTLSWSGTSYNLTNVLFPDGQTMSLIYYPSNTGGNIYNTNSFVSQVTVQPEGSTTSITSYTNALPYITHVTGTGMPDLWTTNTWDGLNRLTSTLFQDGTSISNIYTNLDLGAHKDRVGNWTRYGYDGLQHLLSITNALTNVTRFTWCDCGSLTSISNALGYTTYLNYDNQERLTNVTFPDNSSINWQYDLTQRMTNRFDGAGNSQQYAYNNQNQVITIDNTYGQLFGAYYDAVEGRFR